jgi:hypothetical protein
MSNGKTNTFSLEEMDSPIPPQKRPRSSESSEPLTNDDLAKLIGEGQHAMRLEVRGMKNELVTAINEVKTDVNEMRVSHGNDIEALKEQAQKTTTEMEGLKMKLNEHDQDKFSCHMDISGVAQTHFDITKGDTTLLVTTLLQTRKIKCDKESIRAAYVRNIKRKDATIKIVTVIFTSLEEKLRIMKEKRKETNPKGVYFDHYMTPQTRQLYLLAKRTARERGAKTAALLSGRVYVIKADGSKMRINSAADLDNLQLVDPSATSPTPKA